MKLTFAAAELTAIHQTNLEIARLLGSRFARKADERLGTTVPVIYNDNTSFSQGQIVAVADGVVIRSSFSDTRLYLSAAIDGNGVYYRSKLNDWVSFESDEDAARALLRDHDVEIMTAP